MEGKQDRIRVIAELANAHQGDPRKALNLAKEVVEAGADAIKFQIYFADEFLTTNHPRYAHFKNQAFTKGEWAHLLVEAKKLGVEVYADIFGLEAYEVATEYDIDGYKVHSSDLNNTRVLEKLALQEKRVFLAVGGSTILEIRYAIDILTKFNKPTEIIILHGFQDYPTRIEDSGLARLGKLDELFGHNVLLGYSDHISGDDFFATILPLMSITYGVDYIEKHVTLDRADKGVDYYSSYEPYELKQFIADLRSAESSLGGDPLHFSESEKNYRNGVKKSWTTTRVIEEGEVIRADDIVMKRPLYFFAPPSYEEIVGKRARKSIGHQEAISRNVLENKVLAIIVARSDSSRLPRKAVKLINGKPTLSHLFERVSRAKDLGYVDTIAFCTTTLESDNALIEIAKEYKIDLYRGEVDDVLARMIRAVDDHQDHNVVLRITGDDLLIDADYLYQTVTCHLKHNAHYTDAKRLPSGTEVEVFNGQILKLIHELSKDSSGSEYLTNYITNNIDQFEIASLEVPACHDHNYRLTLDTNEDFEVIKGLLEHMSVIGKEYDYSMDDIFAYFDKHPERLEINKPILQKAPPISVNTDINWKHFTSSPKVTVYITNFNYGDYIRQAIDSVLEQKFRDFEVIIIDDGSTDHSHEIIESYQNHPKVSIVYQENKGLNVTNNIAIKLAKGKYVMRLDADDYLNENALLILSQELDWDEGVGLVFPDYYLVNKEGTILAEEKRHDFSNVTLFDQPAHGACTMIRKDVLDELGGYSEEFTRQDGYELWIKVIRNKRVANVNLPLFYYRQHGNNLTKNKEKLYNTRHDIVRKYSKDLNIIDKHHVAIVPLRDLSDDTMVVRSFAGTTLIDITMDQILATENIKTVVVSTPNQTVLNYMRDRYDDVRLILDERPLKLARINTHIDETISHVVERYALSDSDTFSIINCEYPLRKSFYIDKAINTLYLFESDSVLSVSQESANFYLHQGDGLVPFNSNRDLRLERDFIYKEAGGIHVVSGDTFRQNRCIMGEKTTHIILDEKSSMAVITENDFEYLEYQYMRVQQ